MTMANTAVSSAPRNGVSLRKTNKPLMEKRRRARINDSLTQLKSLVIHSSKKDSSQFSKLEKADILELTVKHLRGLQQQQQQQQQQINQAAAPENSINGKYRAGFIECANEVIRYLDQSQSFGNDTKTKVITHLAQCLQLVSHVQPKQQVANVPAPTTTILNAQPTATATAQLPHGQIIQIVSNAVPNVQASSGSNILGFKPPVSSLQGLNLTASVNQQSTVSAAVQSTTEPTHTAYVHYAQPLHIQIPPIVSPVLIQQGKQGKPVVVSKETTESSSRTSPADHHQDMVSSSTNNPSPHTTSLSSSTSSTPPSHSSLPKVRAQKQLDFYCLDEMNPQFSATKSRSYSMTSSSSSSTSSSPESEMTSPLNLSQSPPFLSQKFETRHHHHHHHRHQTPSTMLHSKHGDHYQGVSQPIPVKAHHKPVPEVIQSHPNFSSLHDRDSSLNATSVIVNSTSRKFPEFDAKYFHMMEDDRHSHCINHQSTPSPASSMGEDRLWRPW